MRRLWTTLIVAGALAAPLEAGIEYQARTWQEGQQASQEAEMTVRARIDGDRARIDFLDSGNPWMGAGTYLLTTDAGRTLFLVKPEEKSYGEFDLDQIMRLLGTLSESGIVGFEIENPRLETLEQGPGKTVAGLPTRHARYRTTYDMRIVILGFKRLQNVETIQDVWYTEELGDAALGVWLRKEPPRTGTELDELIDLEVGKIQGFPLETASTTVTTGKKGKETTTTTWTRVTELRQGASFPADIFEIPADYTPVEMMPTEALAAAGAPPEQDEAREREQEQEEEEGGLLGRFKRLGKKKDG